MFTTDPSLGERYATERRTLVRVAKLLYERRMTELQGGNMSVRVADGTVTTPTRASDVLGWRLDPEDTLILALDGTVLLGADSLISRETRLHLRLYTAFPEVGSVFHLHLPEAIAIAGSGRWRPGVVAATPERYGATVVLLEAGLRAQTEPHDARVVELLSRVGRDGGAISISPRHGVFSVARDWATNVAAADAFRQRLSSDRLRHRLRAARRTGEAGMLAPGSAQLDGIAGEALESVKERPPVAGTRS